MANIVFRSFKNSCNGLRTAWAEDHSFRNAALQTLAAVAIATALEAFHVIGLFYWLILVGAVMPILVVETINTAIEAVTDKASPEHSPLAKKAKDIGSAAVLLTRIYAIICWIVVLWSAQN